MANAMHVKVNRGNGVTVAHDNAPLTITPLTFTVDDLLAAVEPENMLLPGVPTDAYSVIAGALSSYKSTLAIYLAIWKATGYDLLLLDPEGRGVDTGPVLMLGYEDADRRTVNRFRRIVQCAQADIRAVHGAKSAASFVEMVAKNIRRVPLTGQADATLVQRVMENVVPNHGLIDAVLMAAREFTSSGLMMTLDPLRLAIVGSQNDDDIGAVVVHTLNQMATSLTDSGIVVVSHTNKSEAKDPAAGYAGAAYATSGSALYSQHARSNFLMVRLKPDEAADLVGGFTPEDLAAQPIAKLIHGRLSYGQESGERLLQMRAGVLVPVKPREKANLQRQMSEFCVRLAVTLDTFMTDKVLPSKAAIEADSSLGRRQDIRAMLKMCEENGFLEFEGTTSNRRCKLTDKGKALVNLTPKTIGESRREHT